MSGIPAMSLVEVAALIRDGSLSSTSVTAAVL